MVLTRKEAAAVAGEKKKALYLADDYSKVGVNTLASAVEPLNHVLIVSH